jgi:argininosuccinate synthase
MSIKKVVLAYSGGLDTSVIIPWLKEVYGCRVVAFIADIGQGDDYAYLRRKAVKSGADKVVVADLRQEFVSHYLWPMLKAGAMYENRYLLGTAIARPLIAKQQVAVALAEKADAVSHGATGKGNDQVRFELTYMILAPQLKIIAPWKDEHWTIRSRTDAMRYAAKHHIPVPTTAAKPYSMDKNLWHTSFEGGILEDPANEPPEDMCDRIVPLSKAPNGPVYVSITFAKGVPVAVNGRRMPGAALLDKLNGLAGRYGVGRVDMVENRLVGIKSRGVYETPGGTLLTAAHRELEQLTLDRDTLHYKDQVALRYAELVYYGQWFTELRQALDRFVDYTQARVNGTVRLKLYRGHCLPAGKTSPDSLYSLKLATFERDEVYNQKDAKGFIKLFGLPLLRRK